MSEKPSAAVDPAEVDYRVQVAYTAPIEVTVDVSDGTVERVVVIDEWVALDRREGARRETDLAPIPKEVAEMAIEIAERADDPGWPAWEFGF